jgi:methylglyoxal reductase
MRRSLRPDTIQIEIERSLKRLATDYIDLYQVHWPATPPDSTPVADTMACLMKLKAQGKIRAIGVSNVSLAELEEYWAHGELAANQLRYSMLHRAPEADILPYCRSRNIAALAYMSLEQGLLTGKVGVDRVFEQGELRADETWHPWFASGNRRRVLNLLARWREFTRRSTCTLPQLVIAWTLAQPGVTHILCGARRIEQARENAQAGDLSLHEATLQRMRQDVEALGEPAHEEVTV